MREITIMRRPQIMVEQKREIKPLAQLHVGTELGHVERRDRFVALGVECLVVGIIKIGVAVLTLPGEQSVILVGKRE